ncbi:COG4280 domain-containing protein [Polaromonas aquatica]|uniref:COG4280 domain-containing protein n=1 Tax=Polaromonas aquatica TaxID=332657 RepID=A0ABW1TY79_9BURK
MINLVSAGPSVLASFMASMVEFVEALTIVLAVGVVRGWRSALMGTVAGLFFLVALIAIAGPSLSVIPLPVLQFVVGVLLLMFGLRWLRKAILRAAGILALHDESKIFAEQTLALRKFGGSKDKLDKVAFITTFKAVVLEGLEVVFIVIALGANGSLLVPAMAGAGLALLLVVALGGVLHRPLSTVPENTLKFCVGVLLTSFGTYWTGEGVGLHWPGQDLILLALLAAFSGGASVFVVIARPHKGKAVFKVVPGAAKPGRSVLSNAASEIFGLFVEDIWLASGLLIWVGGWWAIYTPGPVDVALPGAGFAMGLVFILGASVLKRARIA